MLMQWMLRPAERIGHIVVRAPGSQLPESPRVQESLIHVNQKYFLIEPFDLNVSNTRNPQQSGEDDVFVRLDKPIFVFPIPGDCVLQYGSVLRIVFTDFYIIQIIR